jgi:sulfur carrier protein
VRVTVNGEPTEIEDPTGRSVRGLLTHLGVAERHGVAVAVNGEVVRRGRWAQHRLRDGDRIEILTPVQGG